MSETEEATQWVGPVAMSATVGELFGALAKAQSKMTIASKDREVKEKRKAKDGSFFTTSRSYATLASTLEAVRPALSTEGVCITQHATRTDRGVVLITTILGHSSGEWMQSTFGTSTEGMQQRGVQALGSAISYLRRYCVQSVCGVAQADDTAEDDGASALPAKASKPKPRAKPKTPPKPRNPAHHESWTRPEQVEFCKSLPKTFGGLTYDGLASYLEAHKRPRPSAMEQETRQALWAWLLDGNADDVVEWCAVQAVAKGAA